MKRLHLLALLTVLLGTAACQSFNTFVDEVAPNSTVNAARAAMQDGELGTALGLYQSVLDAPDANVEERGEALFNLALIRLTPDPDYRDLDAAHGYLTRLGDSRARYRRLEATALAAIVGELLAKDGLIAEKDRELKLQEERIRKITATALGSNPADEP